MQPACFSAVWEGPAPAAQHESPLAALWRARKTPAAMVLSAVACRDDLRMEASLAFSASSLQPESIWRTWVSAARLLRAEACNEVTLSVPVPCSSSLVHHNAAKQLKGACAPSLTCEWQFCQHMLLQHSSHASRQLC